ncbi:MAG: ATP-binding protein [Raineya sp.]|nr:ATP-binding protein [Raineya sp.]MDW8296367.1 ATP-binding protein [Raineya sp.]
MLFNLINNTKLRRKLFIAFFTFTLIIVFVAIMSFWFYAKRDEIHEITNEIEEITTDILKLVKNENNFIEKESLQDKFFQTGISENQKRNRAILQDLRTRISKLIQNKEIQEFGVDNRLQELQKDLKEYEAAFKSFIAKTFQKGNKNFGLENELHKITTQLEEKNQVSLVVLYTLKSFEKDYLMRKDSASFTDFHNAIQEAIQSTTHTESRDLLEKYQQKFIQIATLDKELNLFKNSKDGIYQKMRESSDMAIKKIENISRIVENKVKSMRGQFQNIFVITLLIVVVVSLTFSYFLSFFITIPVTELSRAMHKAIEMNFSEDLKPARKYTNDEIGQLTDDFNLMMKRIQMQFHEIKENARLLLESNQFLQEVNKQLEDSEKRLEKLAAIKETLFNTITQDLKSPLNSLKGFLSLMQHHPDTFSQQELSAVAHDMYVAFDKISVMITSLVQWSQLQTDELDFNPNHFNLSTLIEQVIAQFSPMAESKRIKIFNHAKADFFVDADKDMINFTLRNLLSNAIKFTHEGGKVEIFVQNRGKDKYMISISDTGVGISQELLEKIFQPEIHVSMLGTKKEKGSGFGLMMCKDFIQKNGGKLYIDSELGKGTTVYFTLKKAQKNSSE